MPPNQQHDKLSEVEGKAADLLALLQNDYGVVFDITNDHGLIAELETCLGHLLRRCQEYKPKLPPKEKQRRPKELGQIYFFNELAKIYRDATGRQAPGRFYKLCCELIEIGTSEENIKRIMRPINKYSKKSA